MTKDDIIKLARDCDLGRVCGPLDALLDYEWEALHCFANLVSAAERDVLLRQIRHWGLTTLDIDLVAYIDAMLLPSRSDK